MSTAEAEYLVAKLFAAFPFAQQEMTAAVYVEAMQRLHDPDRALRAVDDLIDNELRLPPVGLIRETYERWKPAPLELEMPDLTPEQIAENLRRRNVLLAALSHEIDFDEALARMSG